MQILTLLTYQKYCYVLGDINTETIKVVIVFTGRIIRSYQIKYLPIWVQFPSVLLGKIKMRNFNELPKLIIKQATLRGFSFWEKLGIHTLPDNFNYPIPSTQNLTDDLFQKESELIGIDMNLDTQVKYLNKVFSRFAIEIDPEENRGLSLVDTAILHSMIRYHKPEQIIEIGSGASTKIAGYSCFMNSNKCELISIDPYLNHTLRCGIVGVSNLIEKKVQEVPVKEFENCDLLFIDSSHVVSIGGDVNYELLEIIPRLKKGCLIHFHDILLPGEYWKDWVKGRNRLFWSEQYLLQAFLAFNTEYEIIWASRYMHLRNANSIKRVFPYFNPEEHRITSFWIRRK